MLSSCWRSVKEQGIELVGPNGLLNEVTKNVLEAALDAEMTEHRDDDKRDTAGRGSGNSRDRRRSFPNPAAFLRPTTAVVNRTTKGRSPAATSPTSPWTNYTLSSPRNTLRQHLPTNTNHLAFQHDSLISPREPRQVRSPPPPTTLSFLTPSANCLRDAGGRLRDVRTG